jgi:hypothetical protein
MLHIVIKVDVPIMNSIVKSITALYSRIWLIARDKDKICKVGCCATTFSVTDTLFIKVKMHL